VRAADAVPAAVDGYGYSEQQIEDNRFWVRFAGNDRTPAGTVQNYWLYRMAELTLDHGYDHFIIVDRKLDRSTTYEGTAQCDCPGYVTEDGDYVGGGGSVSSYSASPSDRYTAFAHAVMFEGEKPAADVNAYDAERVASAEADHRGGTGGGAAHHRTAGLAAARTAAIATDLRRTAGRELRTR
jgi:hypothetical protein